MKFIIFILLPIFSSCAFMEKYLASEIKKNDTSIHLVYYDNKKASFLAQPREAIVDSLSCYCPYSEAIIIAEKHGKENINIEDKNLPKNLANNQNEDLIFFRCKE